MDAYSLLAWTFFYIVIISLFYWCFRQSMSQVASSSSETSSNERTAQPAERPSQRRMAYTAGVGRNIYLITESARPSDASEQLPPPEYKWEDLPPTYEEAVASFTNQAFDDQPASSSGQNSTDVVIELAETTASIN